LLLLSSTKANSTGIIFVCESTLIELLQLDVKTGFHFNSKNKFLCLVLGLKWTKTALPWFEVVKNGPGGELRLRCKPKKKGNINNKLY